MHVRMTLLAAGRSSSVADVCFDEDRALDATGWEEVVRRAPAFSHLAAAELRYCSPSARCRETGAVLGLTPLAQPSLVDWEMGRWRGATLAEVAVREPEAVQQWLTDPRSTPHGGESLLAFIRRIGGWLDTRPVDAGVSAVAVAEPSVLRAALCYALKAPPHAYWNIETHPLATLSLTGRPGDWRLALP